MSKLRKRRFRRWLAEIVLAAIAGPVLVVLLEVWLPVFQDQLILIPGAIAGAVVIFGIIRAVNYSNDTLRQSQLEPTGRGLLGIPRAFWRLLVELACLVTLAALFLPAINSIWVRR